MVKYYVSLGVALAPFIAGCAGLAPSDARQDSTDSPADAAVCKPATCNSAGATCGEQPDGCGGTLVCPPCGGEGGVAEAGSVQAGDDAGAPDAGAGAPDADAGTPDADAGALDAGADGSTCAVEGDAYDYDLYPWLYEDAPPSQQAASCPPSDEPDLPCDPTWDSYCSFDQPQPSSFLGSGPPTPPGTIVQSGGNAATAILDQNFVNALTAFQCPANPAAAGWSYIYFPGIQAYDINVDGVARDALGGDAPTANLYTKYALQGANNAKSSVRNWTLAFYHNTPTVPSMPGRLMGTGYTSYSFTLSDNIRYPVRGAAGNLMLAGDQLATRLLGIWAGTANDANFLAATPAFAAPAPADAAQDAADFGKYFIGYIATQPFTTFMNKAAWNVATSLKCGYPILGHSGGGPAAVFVLRLLALRPGIAAILQGAPATSFAVSGFEEVISSDAVKLLAGYPAYQRGGNPAIVAYNYISGNGDAVPAGSATWSGVIVPQIVSSGFTPLVTTFTGAFWGWPVTGAHGAVGFYPLINGRAPTGNLLQTGR